MTGKAAITGAATRYIAEAASLDDLLSRLSEVDALLTTEAWEALDFCALPTFGGDPIPAHAAVWAWDLDRALVSDWLTGQDEDANAGFVLIPRDQLQRLIRG